VAQHGGYRKPSNPAAVSGPGALSARTDGVPTMALPDAAYGEQKQFKAEQAGAPMANGQQQPAAPPQFTPINAPTGRPGEPVTAGVDIGAGPGSSVLGMKPPLESDLASLMPYLPELEFAANRNPNATTTRALVRMLKARR